MKYRLKETFDQIKAEEELKNRTKVFVSEKIQNDTSSKAGTAGRSIRRLAPVFVCMAILLIGSYWLYFTPAWQISIDINPSIEISMNRLNKVISVKSYNEDGAELADLLDVKYKNYSLSEEVQKPIFLNEMIEISKKLSNQFPFVRIDYVISNNKLYITELTFYPTGGWMTFEPQSFDRYLGDLFITNTKEK